MFLPGYNFKPGPIYLGKYLFAMKSKKVLNCTALKIKMLKVNKYSDNVNVLVDA